MIEKFGKVIITETDIFINGFTFDKANSGSSCSIDALKWALSHMESFLTIESQKED